VIRINARAVGEEVECGEQSQEMIHFCESLHFSDLLGLVFRFTLFWENGGFGRGGYQ